MAQQLHNKIALITGAGSGIGRATAVLFAQEGATVIVVDINAENGQETVQLLTESGSEAHFMQADVTQSAQVAQMVTEVVARYGRLDIAFNNAGIEGAPLRLSDISETDFDQIISVNLKGVWLCLKYELAQMLRQGAGVIVNTASAVGLVGGHSMSVYSASKHGVVGLTRSAAIEYGKKGIRVNAVCPAVIGTDMVTRMLEQFPQIETAVIQNNPSRRLGQPEEVAQAVLWLSSPAASFTNGAVLTVDGGLTAQ